MKLVLTVNPEISATLTDWIVELKGGVQTYQLPIIYGVSDISQSNVFIPIDSSSTSSLISSILTFSFTTR